MSQTQPPLPKFNRTKFATTPPEHQFFTSDVENNLSAGSETFPLTTGTTCPEAEAILALLLQGNQSAILAAKDLQPADFSIETHKHIFDAYTERDKKNIPSDLITICHELNQAGNLEKAGGREHIKDLMNVSANPEMAQYYADCLKSVSQKKRQIKAATALSNAVTNDGNKEKALQDVQDSLAATTNNSSLVRDMIKNVVNDLKVPLMDGLSGIPSGFQDLDALSHGFPPGCLIILAARPSIGKTMMAVNNIGAYAAIQNIAVGIFSIEMGKRDLMERLLSSQSRVSYSSLRAHNIADDEWPKITLAAERIHGMPMYIDNCPGITLGELCARTRRLVRENDVKMIIIDYLQLISLETSGYCENRQQEIAKIARTLKTLAGELNITVMALSQLNRELEKRSDKRPMMSDLRESGAIEQDADMVLFLHREAMYCDDCRKPGVTCSKGHENDAELIIGKMRNGVVGNIPLYFDGATQRFISLEVHKRGQDADNNETVKKGSKNSPDPATKKVNAAESGKQMELGTISTPSKLFKNVQYNDKFDNLTAGVFQ